MYNIGSHDLTPVKEVMAGLIAHANSRSGLSSVPVGLARGALKLMTVLGVSPLMNEQFEIADKNFMLDTSKAEAELGWSSRLSNLDCLTQAFDWYAENRLSSGGQYAGLFGGLLGRFRHSQQGAFQDSDKGLKI